MDASPPLKRQCVVVTLKKTFNAILYSMPPLPFVSWAEALSTQMVVEDLCFWLAPNFGQKIGVSLSEDLFFLSSLILGKNRTKFERRLLFC